ncbi:MAG: ABC transporter permease [Chitinophagales bacterium]
MGKIWIIIQREYISRVKRKAFFITTLLAPLGFLLFMVSSVLISTYNRSTTHIAVVDESGLFKKFDISMPDESDGTLYFHMVDEQYDNVLKQIPNKKEEEGKYQGILFISRDFDINNPQKSPISFRFVKAPGMAKWQVITQRMNDAYQRLRMKMLNLDEKQINEMQRKITLNYDSLINQNEKRGFTLAASAIGMLMGFAIYISLFFYGTMIMKGVQEEKTNRVVEILTSSVKPFQLLMGKIMGVGAVGLTQFILWIVFITLINVAVLPILGMNMSHYSAPAGGMSGAEVDPDNVMEIVQGFKQLPFAQIVVVFPLLFLGGFLLYGSLFAAVGAAMGEDGDQQSLMVPLTVPIVVSILIAINVINNPDSALGFWGSIIPFTAPVVLSARLPFIHDWKQIALSLTLLFAGFLFTAFIAGRIYRIGILMYGKKIKLRDLLSWIFAKG